jgi:hypothetical protein
MQPGTKFCPNHQSLRFPTYANECTVCNEPLQVYGSFAAEIKGGDFPESIFDFNFQTDEVAAQIKPEIVETLAAPILKLDATPDPEGAGPKPAKIIFGDHTPITVKVEEKVKAKKDKKGHK